MTFAQTDHVERDVEERVEENWTFRPSTGYVDRQRFAVVSIVAPTGTNQKAESFGIKIWGAFESQDEATRYSKALQDECNAFDYYVMETQCWHKLPPEVAKLEDIHYQEEQLEKLKRSVLAMRKARAKFLEERILADKARAKTKKEPEGIEETKESMPLPPVTNSSPPIERPSA